MEIISTIKKFLEDSEQYKAYNGKICFRTFANLDYYFLLCNKLNLDPKPIESGLSYEAESDILELDYCEHDLILHIKENPLKTEKRGRICAKLYYDFIKEVYTIKRETKKTNWTERTKDRKKAIELFYNFLYLSIKELEKKLIFKNWSV